MDDDADGDDEDVMVHDSSQAWERILLLLPKKNPCHDEMMTRMSEVGENVYPDDCCDAGDDDEVGEGGETG